MFAKSSASASFLFYCIRCIRKNPDTIVQRDLEVFIFYDKYQNLIIMLIGDCSNKQITENEKGFNKERGSFWSIERRKNPIQILEIYI